MQTKYILAETDKSYCPICSKKVDLLCRDDGKIEHSPWFYICWGCKQAFQVGKGRVKREEKR